MALDRRRLLRTTLGVAAGAAAAAGLVWLQHTDSMPTPIEIKPGDRPGPPLASPFVVDQLFRPGTPLRLDNGVKAVSDTQPAGLLELPTGQLIAVDPSWLYLSAPPGTVPFTVPAPPGTYPLTLGLAVWDQTRVAAARLTIRDEPVTSWEMALRPGQDISTLPPNYFFGIGVDVATIALFDAVVLPEMVRLSTANAPELDLADGRRTSGPVKVATANAIAFETGWGDGSYPVWIGRTSDGSVAAYLVDMLLLPGS